MPEVVPIPDELADPEVIRNRGQWAEKFPGTNMAQRARHNKDTLAYTQQLQDERALREMERVKTDRVAQAAYFREKEFQVRQKTAEDQMQHRAAMLDSTLALREQQTKTAQARERATLAATALKTKTDKLAADDTTGFTQHMNELLDRTTPGTDDYKLGILRGIDVFPHAEKKLVKTFAATALEGDEDLAATLKQVPPGYKASQIRRGVNGKWGFVARETAAATTDGMDMESKRAVDVWSKDRAHWQKERELHLKAAGSSKDDAAKTEAQRRANEAQTQLDRLNTQDPREAKTATAAPATERTATNQKTGERVVLRNGAWVPLTP